MKLLKLTKTDDFSSVFSFRKRLHGEWLIACFKPNALGQHRFGLVVSKKVVKQAVKRNYMKRVLRELCRRSVDVKQGYDVVLQVKKLFCRADIRHVEKDVALLLHQLNNRLLKTD